MSSIDVLFFSAAQVYKNQIIRILLTGLGEDGAAALEAIKNSGSIIITESEETYVVYSMPKTAVKRNTAKLILPNYKMKNFILDYTKKFVYT